MLKVIKAIRIFPANRIELKFVESTTMDTPVVVDIATEPRLEIE